MAKDEMGPISSCKSRTNSMFVQSVWSKRILITLICLNIYVFSFFFWYRLLIVGAMFVENKKPLPKPGIAPISVFLPVTVYGFNEPSGFFTKTVCLFYSPMSGLLEKKGLSIFLDDEKSGREYLWKEAEQPEEIK